MATEPNQSQIEEALKAYAEARRRAADPPFELPPQTRRALQAEIERRWGEPARERARTNWWNVLWPRLAWAVAGVSVVAIGMMAYFGNSGARVRNLQVAATSEAKDGANETRGFTAASSARPKVDTASAVPAKQKLEAGAGTRGEQPTGVGVAGLAESQAAPQPGAEAPDALAVTVPPAAPVPSDASSADAAHSATALRQTESIPPQVTTTNSLAAGEGPGLLPAERAQAVLAPAAHPPTTLSAVAEPEAGARPARARYGLALKRTTDAPPEAPAAAPPAQARPGQLSDTLGFEGSPPQTTASGPFILPAEQRSWFDSATSPPASQHSDSASRSSAETNPPAVAVARNVPVTAPPPSRSGGRASETYLNRVRQMKEQQSALTEGRRFVQAAPARQLRRNFNSPPSAPPPPVLQDFRVRQVGRDLQITDRDGSVYLAQVQAPTPSPDERGATPGLRELEDAPVGLPETRPAPGEPTPSTRGYAAEAAGTAGSRNKAAPGGEAAPVQNFANLQANAVTNELFFGATGTNRSLNQVVVFNGRLVFTNNSIAVPSQPATGSDPETLYLWLNNSTVHGQATVGKRTRVEVKAVPAE